MTEAGLVNKNSEGEYKLTRVGELACYNIPLFIFISNNQKYFRFHNFGYVPIKFVQRMGSFVDTELLHGAPIVLDRWKSIYHNTSKKIRTILVANENEAMVMFPSIDGQFDMRDAFYGTDPDFIEWCEDYFEDCWNNADSFTEKQIRYFDKKYE